MNENERKLKAKPQTIREYKEKVLKTNCRICNKSISEGYGRWLGSGGLICKACVLSDPDLIARVTPKDKKALQEGSDE